jgi:hypothetical protein
MCATSTSGKKQPLAHQASAHRRDRGVEKIEQRALPTPVNHRLDQLQVRASLLVDDEKIVAVEELQTRKGQRCRELSGPHVAHNPRRRRRDQRPFFEAFALEAGSENLRQRA